MWPGTESTVRVQPTEYSPQMSTVRVQPGAGRPLECLGRLGMAWYGLVWLGLAWSEVKTVDFSRMPEDAQKGAKDEVGLL